jgi:hypothetical protein
MIKPAFGRKAVLRAISNCDFTILWHDARYHQMIEKALS